MATGNRRGMQLRQDKALSENNMNMPKGIKDLKNSGLSVARRPVLNDISSNLQINQNGNQRGKVAVTKPTTRLASNLNSTNISIAPKVNSSLSIAPKVNTTSLNTSKLVKGSSVLSKNVSHIPKVAIARPTAGLLNQLNSGTFIRRNRPTLSETDKKEKEWKIDCIVDDVDKSDEFDPFHVGAYCKPIFEYMMTLENKIVIKPDYLADHKYITPGNRSVVVDWLVEVQQEFNVMQETLYLSVGIFDRYLQENKNISRDKLQLIGATSLLLGCKYEEIYVPEISDFVYLSDNAFTKDEVKSCLVDVFRTIHYSLSRPFSLTFLRRFSKVSGARSSQHALAKYFSELALIDCNLACIKPSEIAASALLLATVVTNDPQIEDEPKDLKSFLSMYWVDVMQKHSTYKMDDLVSTVQALANLALHAPEWKYKAVYKKYIGSKMGRIATSALLSSPAMKFIADNTDTC